MDCRNPRCGARAVIANGEVWNVADWQRCRAVSGCDDVMLGRGAVSDPYLVRRIRGLAEPVASEAEWRAFVAGHRRFLGAAYGQGRSAPCAGSAQAGWLPAPNLAAGGGAACGDPPAAHAGRGHCAADQAGTDGLCGDDGGGGRGRIRQCSLATRPESHVRQPGYRRAHRPASTNASWRWSTGISREPFRADLDYKPGRPSQRAWRRGAASRRSFSMPPAARGEQRATGTTPSALLCCRSRSIGGTVGYGQGRTAGQPVPDPCRSGRLLACSPTLASSLNGIACSIPNPWPKIGHVCRAIGFGHAIFPVLDVWRCDRVPQQLVDLRRGIRLCAGGVCWGAISAGSALISDDPVSPFERKYRDSGQQLYRCVVDLVTPQSCTDCGACCAAFRVVSIRWNWRGPSRGREGAGGDDGSRYQNSCDVWHRRFIPRCVALNGTLGGASHVQSMPRPSPCREFEAAHDAYQRARARHGLPPPNRS